MWPGQQPPGGEQNPQDQNPYQQPGYQQPNPYQQPGYQQTGYPQPNPYGQQPGQPQWGVPSEPLGAPQAPGGSGAGGGGGNKTKITAIVAASAVVIAAGVTGFLVLGGDKEDNAGGDPSKSPTTTASASTSPSASGGDDNPRGGDEEKATIAGWKVVVNPKWGTAFDVPAEWEVQTPGTFIGFEDDAKGDGSVLIGMSAPAFLQEKWCTSDADKDGYEEDSALAAVGTKGQSGAKNTDDVARNDSAWWVFGGYTDQKDASKKLLTIGEPKAYTTASGIKGSLVTTYSSGVPKKDKCDSDGKATTFAFKNSADDFVSWTFYGAKGVSEEVSDATVQKILGTVRLHGEPTG
ncbi:hypothetical protein [Streptomyces sp. NBC_00620]|uniref:hypothetical protein n=1 Tax=unclassified Streptomyces TaxID=2593676 RepID=UPI002252F368|nr:hypothetical protein [Streptomyces sp. NBC_00620]MCX4976269.1 hypothetical protein [Streptomyces sp. NBC_00620]WTB42713.1 hypothetical protein OG569_34325 [Streptomyces sp. NBC_00827]WUC09620.1 hypothetical protein OG256_06865 [Streptomyces sp. NBC_00564]WUC54034.1 hypothetical protein OG266_39125 [Streptomyces sp. NBC_00554]